MRSEKDIVHRVFTQKNATRHDPVIDLVGKFFTSLQSPNRVCCENVFLIWYRPSGRRFKWLWLRKLSLFILPPVRFAYTRVRFANPDEGRA